MDALVACMQFGLSLSLLWRINTTANGSGRPGVSSLRADRGASDTRPLTRAARTAAFAPRAPELRRPYQNIPAEGSIRTSPRVR